VSCGPFACAESSEACAAGITKMGIDANFNIQL